MRLKPLRWRLSNAACKSTLGGSTQGSWSRPRVYDPNEVPQAFCSCKDACLYEFKRDSERTIPPKWKSRNGWEWCPTVGVSDQLVRNGSWGLVYLPRWQRPCGKMMSKIVSRESWGGGWFQKILSVSSLHHNQIGFTVHFVCVQSDFQVQSEEENCFQPEFYWPSSFPQVFHTNCKQCFEILWKEHFLFTGNCVHYQWLALSLSFPPSVLHTPWAQHNKESGALTGKPIITLCKSVETVSTFGDSCIIMTREFSSSACDSLGQKLWQ